VFTRTMSLPQKLRLLAVIPILLIVVLFMFVLQGELENYATYEKDEKVLMVRGALSSLITALQVERGLSAIGDDNGSRLFAHASKQVDTRYTLFLKTILDHEAAYGDIILNEKQMKQMLQAIRKKRDKAQYLVQFEQYSTLIETMLTALHTLIPKTLHHNHAVVLSQLVNLQEYYAQERGLSALFEMEPMLQFYILQRLTILQAHEKILKDALMADYEKPMHDALKQLFSSKAFVFTKQMHARYQSRLKQTILFETLKQQALLQATFLEKKSADANISEKFHTFFSTAERAIAQMNALHDDLAQATRVRTLLERLKTDVAQTPFDRNAFQHDLAHLHAAYTAYLHTPLVTLRSVTLFERYSFLVNQIEARHIEMLNQLLAQMKSKKVASKQELFLLLFLILFLLVVASVAAMKVYGSLIRSIEQIATALQHFFQYLKDERNDIEYIDMVSNDQLGSMAQEINAGIDEVQKQLLYDRELIVELLKVIALMKEGDFSKRIAIHSKSLQFEQLIELFNSFLDVVNEKIDDQTASLQRLNITLEQKVQDATEVLQQKLRALQEFEAAINASAIVLYLDSNGRITYCNAAFEEAFLYTLEQCKTQSIDSFLEGDTLRFALLKQRSSKGLWRGTVACRRQNEEHFFVETTIMPQYDEQRYVRSYIVLGQDITQLVEARDEAIRLQHLKERFFSNMSHEIRTPLNAVIGFSEIVSRTLHDSKLQRYMQIISSSSNTLLQIINDILDFSKIEAGELTLHIEPSAFSEEIGSHLALLSVPAYEKELMLLSFIDPTIPAQLIGDVHRVKQMVGNLYSNAIKFTPEHGTVFVKIYYEHQQLHIIIRDTGIGIDASALERIFNPYEQADSSTTRLFGGTGLGLAITKTLAKQMDAKLNVKSKVGVGSEFSLQIPLLEVKNDNSGNGVLDDSLHALHVTLIQSDSPLIALFGRYLDFFEIENKVVKSVDDISSEDIVVMAYDDALLATVTEHSHRTVLLLTSPNDTLQCQQNCWPLIAPFDATRLLEALDEVTENELRALKEEKRAALEFDASVLVVEDNKTNQLVISLKLQTYHIDVDVANDGLEALEMVKKRRYDLILMDENMPNMSGIESLHAIRAFEAQEQIPKQCIVALTANVMMGDRERFLKEGMDDYLAKPIDDIELERVLLSYLSLQ